MTVTEVRQALGSWEVRLRDNTPRSVLDALTYFGHIVIVPGQLNPAEYGDSLLAAARYVGVYRNRSASNQFLLRGSGMAFWLGDEDGKGDVFETSVDLAAATFAASIAALLPPGGAVTSGTINSVAGTYTGSHRWQTSRQALDYVTQLFGAEWRVSNSGTLDAGTIAQLYVTDPRTILMRKETGAELRIRALPGRMELGSDAEDYTTRVVVLAEGEGDQIQTGEADILSTPFNDLHGNDVKFTRLISESDTEAANADARAALFLAQYSGERNSVSLSTSAFDIKGDLAVGDYLNIYDPDSGYVDTSREVYWEGQPINPVALRCIELTWPVPHNWTVAFRTVNGTWIDLRQYYAGEEGETTITVGDLSRSLTTAEPIGIRTNLPPSSGADETIPDEPVFTLFSPGSYQSVSTNTTKALMRVQWTTPLNIDASVITDGAFYDLRWRTNVVIGYEVPWSALEGEGWDDLDGNPYATLLSDPVSATPEWNYMQVGWGTNEATVMELTPGVEYEFQIRAVDAAFPPHYGSFSPSSFVVTVGDLFAPSTPAVPVVAASRIAIQVVHELGKSSGGTFNLEPDLDHLEVHVGGSSSFFPDDSTMIGKLIATAGMIGGHIPAVGTFAVEQVDLIWIKVVAVDRAGNKSGASAGVTVTAELIDDAHISSLTVSKLTAGTITADTVMAAQMEVTGDIIINEGSLNVLDNLGAVQIESGLLSDGSYGLAARNALDQLVPLARLAFGLKFARNASFVQTHTTGSFADLGGPEVNDVEVGDLGQMMIWIGADIFTGGSATVLAGAGYLGFEIIRQATATQVLAPSTNRMAQKFMLTSDTLMQFQSNAMFFYVADSLVPGLYTVKLWYSSDDSSGSRDAEFTNRFIVVFPY